MKNMSDTILSISNWNDLYENNRTRDLKTLLWVPIPNKQDGDGYTEIMGEKDGVQIFGAWIAILQIASRCDPRGTLVRDGGKPHDCGSISRMCRIPQPIVSRAISFCSKIGWINGLQKDCENVAPKCEKVALECLEGKGREGNRIEGIYSVDFESFWKAYPKRIGKGAAYKSWQKAKPDIQTVLTALAWQNKSDQWTKDSGQFIPHPTTYINQSRWEDEPIVVSNRPAAPVQAQKQSLGALQMQIAQWTAERKNIFRPGEPDSPRFKELTRLINEAKRKCEEGF